MANESSSANPSLRLHEVLESEFVALHGDLPTGYPSAANDSAKRLKAVWSAVHDLKPRRAALCISGGGIRSATFGLGILQGLARCGLLEKFHYLSTVSGGGYIGGWLSAWIHNSEGGLPDVVRQLAEPRTDARPNPEPKEIQNLRSYSNYLSPRLGLLSADSWTLAGTYLRNLFLNWWVIIPLLGAVLTLPWIYTSVLMSNPPPYTYLPLSIGAACIVPGVGYMGINLPCGGNLRWSQNRFLYFCLLPLLLASVLMTTHWAWFTYYGRHLLAWPLFGFGPSHTWVPFLYLGITIHLFSWLGSLLPSHGFRFFEFLAVIITGAIGGGLLWLGATQLFPAADRKDGVVYGFCRPAFHGAVFPGDHGFRGSFESLDERSGSRMVGTRDGLAHRGGDWMDGDQLARHSWSVSSFRFHYRDLDCDNRRHCRRIDRPRRPQQFDSCEHKAGRRSRTSLQKFSRKRPVSQRSSSSPCS